MQVVSTILMIVILIGVPAVLMSVTYASRLYHCYECGHMIVRKWYQVIFRWGRHESGLLLTCPKCDRYIIANGV